MEYRLGCLGILIGGVCENDGIENTTGDGRMDIRRT
jgi:hypothetical protein